MTSDEIRAKVLAALAAVVPELDPAELRPDRPIRDELDIDSMDFLTFTIGLAKAFGIEIPEADYRRLATLNACVDYVAAALAGRK
jgi:acyl carrier protein